MNQELKLSDYMLLGAAQTQPLKGQYYLHVEDGVIGWACALSAAVVGKVGNEVDYIGLATICKLFTDELVFQPVKHPVTLKPMQLADVITDLNDYRGWTREQIAAWLKEIGL